MRKPIEEALADLLAEYADLPPGDLISALEMQLYALKEEHGEED
jgi:hypothetical protein